MKRNIYALSLTIAAMCGNTVCFAQDTTTSTTTEVAVSEVELTEVEQAEVIRVTTDDLFSNRDFKTEYNNAETFTTINLSDNNTTVLGEGVSIDNNTNIISIRAEGTYVLNGTLTDGQVYINCDKTEKVQLILNGVNITNNTSAPIYVEQADKVFITTSASTSNNLNAIIPENDETGIDAVIFSREDITLNGEGSLSLIGVNANGITSKDEVRFTSGSYTIVADKHGIEANDAIKIAGGTFNITAEKDGLQADAGEDTTLGFIHIFDGNFNIKAQDDCLQSSGYLTLEDGNFVLDAQDDATHAGTNLTIYGGNYEISSVDDAIHAELNVTIYDGEINIITSYEGIEAQMVDIHGGNISMYCNDDGINAAIGGESTTNDMLGGGMMRPQGGMMDMMPNIDLPEGELTQENFQELMAQIQQQVGGQMGQQQQLDPQVQQQMGGQMGQQQQLDPQIQQQMGGQMGQQQQLDPQVQQQMGGQMGQQQQLDPQVQQQIEPQIPQILGQVPNSQVVVSPISQNLEFPIQINSLEEASELCAVISSDSSTEQVDSRVYINITGGNIYIDSNSEGDGLDSNGDITISGGNLIISSTTDVRDTALDYNNSGSITGGSIIASGSASRTVQNFGTNSTQGSIVVVLDSITSGEFKLTDASGNIVASFNPPKDYQAILISNDSIVQGETYTLTTPLGDKVIQMESNIYTEGSASDEMFSMRGDRTNTTQQQVARP